ncbi:MAG TPA: hypothetical protein VMH84_18830 [Xanthobacteraceae bacterium]|nr:hypothetical protein [Xanthobacteraceae bacterium]
MLPSIAENSRGIINIQLDMSAGAPENPEYRNDKQLKLSYNKERYEVTGEGYRIRQVGGKSGEDLSGIFLYQDKNVEFYFLAERSVWVQLGKRTHDTENYVVHRLWCRDQSCVGTYRDISDDLKRVAKENILQGMMLMEGLFEKKPPKGVSFSNPNL